MSVYDAAVIGGGPSGLYAARLLAQRGLSVIVLERKQEIGADVVCTGIVGREIFREFSLPEESVLTELQTIKLALSSGRELAYRHPVPFAAIVDRKKFDVVLTLEAQGAGVDVKLGYQVAGLVRERGCVHIDAETSPGNRRKIVARMAVLATGNDYRLHGKLRLGCPNDFFLGAQAEWVAPGETIPTVFIGRDIAPGGFAWAVPAGNIVRIGLVTKHNPQLYFRSFARRCFPGLDRQNPSRSLKVKAIAQGLVSRSYDDGVLALGEAAGQVKTTTGGGIYYGLHCAQIAAEVILRCHRAGSFSAQRLAEYERLWKDSLEKEIRVGYFARRLYARLNQAQIEKIFELVQSDGIFPLVERTANFDWQSDLLMDLIERASAFPIIKALLKRPSIFRRYRP